MLLAITRKKAESFLKRDSAKVPREDIMTDAVFGGLRYFDGIQAGTALHWLMPDVVPTGSEVSEVRLWPKRESVEPDVVIDLISSVGEGFRVIIEAKWLDNVLTSGQLDAQWLVFGPGTPGAPEKVLHILLVQRRIRVAPEAYTAAPDEVRSVRHLMTWRDLSAAASKRNRSVGSEQVNTWISDVIRVIDLGDGRTFTGWSALPNVEPPGSFFLARFWNSLADEPAIDPPASVFKLRST